MTTKKPSEQTWRVGRRVKRTLYRHDDNKEDGVLIGVMDTPELATLAAAAPELLRALETAEWAAVEDCNGEPKCPICSKRESNGHVPDCQLAAALRKARGEP